MIKLKDILNEEVYGNKATVYHRTRSEDLMTNLMTSPFENSVGMYGKGIYTTYMPTWKTNWAENSKKDKINPATNTKYKNRQIQRSENPEGRQNYNEYGHIQVKFSVDLINFFIFEWNIYQKVADHVKKVERNAGKKSHINNFINLQAEYFGLSHRIKTPYRKRYTSKLALKFGFKTGYRYNMNPNINGIIFFGSRDGNVLVCYNTNIIVPLSMRNDKTKQTIKLKKILDSDLSLKNGFKEYLTRFLKAKDASMSNDRIDLKPDFQSLINELVVKYNLTKGEDGRYSTDGNVKITDDYIHNGKFIIKFNQVGGDFDCSGCHLLESMQGAPEEVGGDFMCFVCPSLQSLEGSPRTVGGNFNCSSCHLLESLIGTPKIINGDFECKNCRKLQSLEGAPEEVSGNFNCTGCNSLQFLNGSPRIVIGDFNCSGCTSLISLEGASHTVGGNFNCNICMSIESLKGAPKKVGGNFGCGGCRLLKSLKGAPEEVGGNFECISCDSLQSLEYLPKAKHHEVPIHLYHELKNILGRNI